MQPHRVLGVSTMPGIAGVIASFGMFYIAERVLHLDCEVVQTLMYLKLSVAGHLNIFVTRTRGPFWSIMPARILLIAVFGTQALATIIAVSRLLMPAISWELAGLVWGYALVWFLINDQVKLLGYRILDPKGAPVIAQRGPAKAVTAVPSVREPRPVFALRVPRVVFLKPQVEDVRESQAGDQNSGATPAQKRNRPNHGHGGTLLKVEGAR